MNTHNPILLIEDNPDDELLILRAFKKSNIANAVIAARDGQEALDWLFGEGSWDGRDMSIQPALILLDLKIPKISGLEVLRAMRQDPRTRLLPVTILTSSDEEHDIINGYDLGANSYVHKPVDFDEFALAVRELGLYWLVLNRVPPTTYAAASRVSGVHSTVSGEAT